MTGIGVGNQIGMGSAQGVADVVATYPEGINDVWVATDANSFDDGVDDQAFNSLTGNNNLIVGQNDVETIRDPEFTGTVGDSAAYFVVDGVDYFTAESGNPFLSDINTTSKSWTLGFYFKLPDTLASNDILFSSNSSDPNLIVCYVTNGGAIKIWQESGGSGSYKGTTPSGLFSGGDHVFISLYYDHVNNLMGYAVNGRTYSTVSCTFVTPTADMTFFYFFGRETSTLSLSVNGLIYGMSYRASVATNANLSEEADFANTWFDNISVPA